MPARIGISFTNNDGDDYTLTIYDSEYIGVEFDGVLDGAADISIKWRKVTDRYSPVMSSECIFSLLETSSTSPSVSNLITAMIDADEGQLTVQIEKNSSLFWSGIVLTDNITVENTQNLPRSLKIRAVDGLARLKDIPYNNDGTEFTGKETMVTHLLNALNKIGYADAYGASDTFLAVVNNWREEQMDSSGNMLDHTRIRHNAFIRIDNLGYVESFSCLRVIEEICKRTASRLMQSDGIFRLVQLREYEEANIANVYQYQKGGTSNTTLTSQAWESVADVNDAASWDLTLYKGALWIYKPPLRRVEENYKHFAFIQNLLSDNWSYGADNTTSIDNVDTNSNTSRFRVVFNLYYRREQGDPDPIFVVNPLYFVFKLKIQSDTYWLARGYQYNNGNVTYDNITWETTESYYYVVGKQNSWDWQSLQQDFITPFLPEDSTYDIDFTLEQIHTFDQSAVTLDSLVDYITYAGTPYVNIIYDFQEGNQSSLTLFSAENTDTGNSKIYSYEMTIGDGPNPNVNGALEIYNGATWEASDGWRRGGTGSYQDISQLTVETILRGQTKPLQVFKGAARGSYSAHYRLSYDSDLYVFNGGDFRVMDNIWNFEAWLIKDNPSQVTGDTPVDVFYPDIKNNDDPPWGPPPPPPDEPNGPSVNPNAFSPNTDYFGGAVVTTEISDGDTVTSIDITSIDVDGYFLAGDTITVIDSVTGQTQDFIVTTDVGASDTSISVTSTTADFDISVGSTVILNPTTSQAALVRYKQRFTNVTTDNVVITENGGVLPDETEKIDVYINGKFVDDDEWSHSGDTITFTYTLADENVVVKFWP